MSRQSLAWLGAIAAMGATDQVFLHNYHDLPTHYSMPAGHYRKHNKRQEHLDMLHKHKTIKSNRKKAKAAKKARKTNRH